MKAATSSHTGEDLSMPKARHHLTNDENSQVNNKDNSWTALRSTIKAARFMDFVLNLNSHIDDSSRFSFYVETSS